MCHTAGDRALGERQRRERGGDNRKSNKRERQGVFPYSETMTGWIGECVLHEVLSGKDNGIYDAMNKSLRNATGDYILFLNAGDELYDKDTLKKVFATKANADVYYGNTAVMNVQGEVIGDRRLKPPAVMDWKSLRHGMCVSHQSFIAKRLLCDFYNVDYRIAADIDWVINVLKQSESTVNTGIYISKFLAGGTSHHHQRFAWMERFRIMTKHYGLVATLWNHFYILLRYPLHKLTKKSMT